MVSNESLIMISYLTLIVTICLTCSVSEIWSITNHCNSIFCQKCLKCTKYILITFVFISPKIVLPMATSEAAKPSKKCCISFLVSKLGAKLLYLHQLRAKQSYLQNFTNLFSSLLYLDLWNKYLDISYHEL